MPDFSYAEWLGVATASWLALCAIFVVGANLWERRRGRRTWWRS
jgi:hypothetical protein